MNLLCIDYGEAKIGIAVSSGKLAAPLKVIKYSDIAKLLLELEKIVRAENIAKIIVGISEGTSANKSYEFGNNLGDKLKLPVEFMDETLSTIDAQILSIESGMRRKKRKQMEDAYAAALILQKYLDNLQE